MMEKKDKNLFLGLFGVVLFFLLISTCNGMKIKKKIISLEKDNTSLTNKIDSVLEITPTQELIELVVEKEGYEVSKRILYDNNAIIRTTIRPDDRMNEYDKEIYRIDKEIKSLE